MGKGPVAAFAVAVLLALPAVARAENATVEHGLNTVYTGSSLVDDVTELLINSGTQWRFDQGSTPGAALMSTSTCNDVFGNGTRIVCAISGGVIFNLNSGNDRVLAGETGHGMIFDGGAGNDFLSVGGDAINTISGGADDDTILVSTAHNQNTIDGGTGNDTIQYPIGPDLMNGGVGVDTVVYSTGVGTAVNASLDDLQNDGKVGDLPGNLHSDIENLTGGDEDDTFTGSAAPNVLISGNGNDTINARNGVHDTIDCGNGQDTANIDGVDLPVPGCEQVNIPDADHDGFTEDQDCNDHAAGVHPGAPEIPGNGIDENCDGVDAPLPIVDNDHDGSVPPADCNDHNAAVHPGATDVPQNGVDENCDGHDAAFPMLDAPVTNRWLSGSTTRVVQLEVKGLPANAKVTVKCKGRSCPFKSKTAKVRGGRAKLTSFFKHRRLKPGTRIDVSITAPAAIGKLVRFTIRRNKIPKVQALCIKPGARAPVRC
jgi:hypothetical protein